VSSSAYSAEIRPDPGLRLVVMAMALFLSAVGVVVAATLPLQVWARVLAGVCWLALGGRELYKIRQGQVLCRRIRINAEAELSLLGPDGNWQVGRLLPGSVVLRSIAWIRVAGADGQHFAELVRGCGRESRDWRRLQVIWRHIGATP